MRDIVLLSILPFLVYAIFQRSFIGLGLWIWTAMFFPNGWVYGIAGVIRYNLLFAGLTIGVYFMSKQKLRLQLGTVGWMVILFLIWTFFTTLFGLAIPDVAWEEWTKLVKIVALFVFILLIIEKKLHIDFFLWCLIFSVGFFAAVEGLKYIVSGGGHHIEGMMGHVLQDNNQLALALAALLPICFYLLGEYGKKSWILKFGLLSLIVLDITSIIGTNSRGGLVALATVGGYLFIKSKRKFLFVLLVLGIGSAMVGLIPEQWFNRMDTLNNASADGSFMDRVVAWKLSTILAIQNPIFGGGFKALEYPPNWFALAQDYYRYPILHFGTVPNPRESHAAHSIYFQVLGDHGFIGLFIFLMIYVTSFFKAGSIAKKIRLANGPEWMINLATMLRLSIFTYAVGGAALSLAYFDMTFAICGLVLILETKFLPEMIKDGEKLKKPLDLRITDSNM
ncbi:MAG: putative O-glycosylation ligase, exosortase A system-associated [Undibacterium sp.]|uniref:putative O-glycosylation ligase, exosortase A system-associated n=1 Tax=Undibacterium sp. TaxID=1914977 RepID=UPI0027269B25|nr:putative O-glycosylation ligase, exosortase A system-associated [Undibacterium sp.]MDO8651361.1 putative O-glycosylation ligase, exosortase A system-associated [Undibacterium sp.]